MHFPDTFLYSISWEDVDTDKPVLDIQPHDNVLSLTGGGDNIFSLLLEGAKKITTVDINPAQYHLMELKCKTITNTDYKTLWKIFGQGKYEGFQRYLQNYMHKELSPSSMMFWKRKAHYFMDSLYYHGAMGRMIKIVNMMGLKYLFTNDNVSKNSWLYKTSLCFFKHFISVFGYVIGNTSIMWNVFGVPERQVKMITQDDNRSISEYLITSLLTVFTTTDIINDNHYYYLILNGRYSKSNCPDNLMEKNYNILKEKVQKVIVNVNDSILNVLSNSDELFDKVILMDHMDWMDETYVNKLCNLLKNKLTQTGKIIWRSSSLYPWYVDIFESHGFLCTNLSNHVDNPYMDRVNTYASFWVAEIH